MLKKMLWEQVRLTFWANEGNWRLQLVIGGVQPARCLKSQVSETRLEV